MPEKTLFLCTKKSSAADKKGLKTRGRMDFGDDKLYFSVTCTDEVPLDEKRWKLWKDHLNYVCKGFKSFLKGCGLCPDGVSLRDIGKNLDSKVVGLLGSSYNKGWEGKPLECRVYLTLGFKREISGKDIGKQAVNYFDSLSLSAILEDDDVNVLAEMKEENYTLTNETVDKLLEPGFHSCVKVDKAIGDLNSEFVEQRKFFETLFKNSLSGLKSNLS